MGARSVGLVLRMAVAAGSDDDLIEAGIAQAVDELEVLRPHLAGPAGRQAASLLSGVQERLRLLQEVRLLEVQEASRGRGR